MNKHDIYTRMTEKNFCTKLGRVLGNLDKSPGTQTSHDDESGSHLQWSLYSAL